MNKMTAQEYREILKLYAIPLHEVLVANGYDLLERGTSGSKWIKLKKEEDEVAGTLLVSKRWDEKKKQEVYLYCNTSNDWDRGNIINFCTNRGIDINDLLKEWREIYAKGNQEELQKIKITSRSEGNSLIHFNQYNKFEKADLQESILLMNRGIYTKSALAYSDSIKQDDKTNLVFPNYSIHKTPSGKEFFAIAGYTVRLNRTLTHNADGSPRERPLKQYTQGEKGLEILPPNGSKDLEYTNIKSILITESIIDSLSLLQLKDFDPNSTLLVSTNGNFSKEKMNQLILGLVEQVKTHRETKNPDIEKLDIVLAMDNDEKGRLFRKNLEMPLLNLNGGKLRVYVPHSKDCNDDLKISHIIGSNSVSATSVKQYCKQKINLYPKAKTSTRESILKEFRDLDKMGVLSQDTKEAFNALHKHKSIKGFDTSNGIKR